MHSFRNPQQQSIITPYFKKAADGIAEIILHFVVISEFVYVMQKIYQIDVNEINITLNQILYSKGIKTVNDVNEISILKIWPKITKDWGNAVLTNYVLENKDMIVLRFDKKFRNVLKNQNLLYEEI